MTEASGGRREEARAMRRPIATERARVWEGCHTPVEERRGVKAPVVKRPWRATGA